MYLIFVYYLPFLNKSVKEKIPNNLQWSPKNVKIVKAFKIFS